MKNWFLLFGMLISFACCGQETIKGTVYDKHGPMPGVIVSEEGNDHKVITNAKGEFVIAASTSNATLTFSFVGFHSRTVKIGKSKTIKVKMKWEGQKYEGDEGNN